MREASVIKGNYHCLPLLSNAFHIQIQGVFVEDKVHIVTLVINDIEDAYHPVTELLHGYASKIKLRVGYPMQDKKVSVIFLVMEMNLDDMGAFAGKMGQLKSVKVKSITLKI